MGNGSPKNEISKNLGSETSFPQLEVPPFRVQSIEFNTVEVLANKPYIRIAAIEELDTQVSLPKHSNVFVLVTHKCFSEKILVEGGVTKRNVIRSTRIAFRKIYQEARVLGVRRELNSLRTLIVYFFRIEFENNHLILIPETFCDDPVA